MPNKSNVMNRLDAKAKLILGSKPLIAHILQSVASEFQGQTISEIISCINDEPKIGKKKVYPQINPLQNESYIQNEGKVVFDVLCSATTKDKEKISLIINIEAQNNSSPGYDLVTRGIFYCARLLSQQMSVNVFPKNYDALQKVYSIWICMDPPKGAQHTISRYKMQRDNLLGNEQSSHRCDLLQVIMIHIDPDHWESCDDPLIGILSTIFSDGQEDEKKIETIKGYGGKDVIPSIRKELPEMCNYSLTVLQRGEKKGYKRGIEQCTAQSIVRMWNRLKKIGCPNTEIISALIEDFPDSDILTVLTKAGINYSDN